MTERKIKQVRSNPDQPKSTYVDAAETRERMADKMKEANAAVEDFAEALTQSDRKRGSREPITFTVPNGCVVNMAPPPEAIQYRLARIYKKDLIDDLSQSYAKAQFYIRSVNGTHIPLANNRLDLERVANMLDTDGLDMVLEQYLEHFTGVDLDALKKNNG